MHSGMLHSQQNFDNNIKTKVEIKSLKLKIERYGLFVKTKVQIKSLKSKFRDITFLSRPKSKTKVLNPKLKELDLEKFRL